MDGLGGTPYVTFSCLKERVEKEGHKVVYLPVNGIKTHSDRVKRIIDGVEAFYKPEGKLFLVGQSAGGSAVRIACEDLNTAKKVSGIILLSPAMPRGIWYMTWTLFWTMLNWRYIWKLLLGIGEIVLRRLDYVQLISPIKCDLLDHASSRISPISSQEIRELAFNPPSLQPIHVHTLIIYGKRDKVIRPASFHQLARKIGRVSRSCEVVCFGEAGHTTLLSKGRCTVVERILKWVNNLNPPTQR
jgi:alpha-beta hydrolase superfamily lysophospholipase